MISDMDRLEEVYEEIAKYRASEKEGYCDDAIYDLIEERDCLELEIYGYYKTLRDARLWWKGIK